MAEKRVSFCMIVRNGGATLSSCLESVAPLVDEIVVVDTGSTDDTVDVARAHGARVLSTPWPDDFAAARNVYMRAARFPWILSLDADETLAPVNATSFRSMLSQHVDCSFVFTIRNYFVLKDWEGPMPPSAFGGEVEPGVGWTPSHTVRLFARRKGMAYRYPVHESLIPASRAQGLSIRPCNIPIHHTGLLAPTTNGAPKSEMYKRLGLRKVTQFPRVFLSYLELGQVFLAEGDTTNADRMFTLCLRLNPFCSRAYYFFIMSALRAGNNTQAQQRAKRARRILPKDGDIIYAQGLVELELGNMTAAVGTLAPVLLQMRPPADLVSALHLPAN